MAMHTFKIYEKLPLSAVLSKNRDGNLDTRDIKIFVPTWSEWNYRIQRSQNYKNDIRVVINQHFHQY